MAASVKLCPAYEVPLPIQLGRSKPKVQVSEEIVNIAVEKVAKSEKVNLSPVLQLSPIKKKKNCNKNTNRDNDSAVLTPSSSCQLSSPTVKNPFFKVSPKQQHFNKIFGVENSGSGSEMSENDQPQCEKAKINNKSEINEKSSPKMCQNNESGNGNTGDFQAKSENHQQLCDKINNESETIKKISPKRRLFSEDFTDNNDTEKNTPAETTFELEPMSDKDLNFDDQPQSEISKISNIEMSKMNQEKPLSTPLKEDKSTERDAKKECEHCFVWVSEQNFEKHVVSCKLYRKFMKKNSVGYECKICPSMAKYRKNLIAHLKEKHQENLDSGELPANLSLDSNNEKKNPKNEKIVANKKTCKKECEFCNELISESMLPKHIVSCKLFYKFMKKSDVGFECILCQNNQTHRQNMYGHVRDKHSAELQKHSAEIEKVKGNKNPAIQGIKDNKSNTQNCMEKGNKNSNTTLHESIREIKDQPESKRAKLECENCQAWVTDYVFPKHIASCNLYHKFMKKNAVGFECRLCPSMAKHKQNIITHIKDKHQEYLKSTNNDKVKETDEKGFETSPKSSTTSSPDSTKENNDQQNKDTSEKKRPKKKSENFQQTSNKKPQFGQENNMLSPRTQQNSSSAPHAKGETSKTTPDGGKKQKSILSWIVKV